MNLKRLFMSGNTTPLPWRLLTALLLVMSFGTSEADTGYYAGIIASSMGIGQTIFSLIWGSIADGKGKKTTLIASTASMMIATLAFGFSRSFTWAVTTRFIVGASLGISLISKSIIADVCDDTNMAFAMTILLSTVSVGFIIGPSLAGFLAFPAEQYPDTFSQDSVFGRFGILLPNLVLAIGLAIGIILIVLFIPNKTRTKNGGTPLLNSSTQTKEDLITRAVENATGEKKSSQYATFSLHSKDNAQQRGWRTWLTKVKTYKLIKLICTKDYARVNVVYFTIGMNAFGNHEILPLFAASSTEYHGMGFSTSKIGLTLLMVSACFLPCQLSIIPKIIRRYGSRKTLIGCNLLLAFVCPWTPILVNIISNRTAAWMAVVVVSFLQRLCMATVFVSINILLNNSVSPDLLGSANGFSMIFLSLGRMIAPLIVGSTYSWSLKNILDVSSNYNPIGFPFDQHFSFYVLSMMAIFNSFLASKISPTLDKKKIMSSVIPLNRDAVRNAPESTL
ncbi:uncharacterized protein LOC130636530 isoform X2 [Hydractinia symbiolongicarpus]|uniref:uncharacterized protein LOC130636530 isoform X2 n=1 Tax=Hydractinia symbiolongicarpus TaxID=13093 RepID=UPI00254EBC70|nr:uncharacterized protein LOC130636530 isoform X2 [Hydractinia symbiolongicarpus]